MLAYPILALRSILLGFSNLIRRTRKPPDYVTFTLESEYAELSPPAGNFLLRRLRPPKPSLQDLAIQFQSVAQDPRVRGIVLHLRPMSMPSAALESLRDLILDTRKSGKKVIAWATHYSAASYHVACAADQVLMQPIGNLSPLGLASTYPYLADSLARVGVKADFIPISPYKSAGDMFSRNDMSDEVRAMSNWLMDGLFEERLRAIEAGRGVDRAGALELVDSTPCTDLRALELGAVDALLGEEHLPDHLAEDGKPAGLEPWASARRRLLRPLPRRPGKYVALVPIEGTILDGTSGRPPIEPPFQVPLLLEPRAGDLTVVQALRQAMLDRRAAAVVVYVNSRGGSETASEAMHAALKKLAAAKPLIIAMGPVAASGGYWVSTPGHLIMAQPSTITGSIGVFLGKMVTGGLLDRLSMGRETIWRGRFIRIGSGESHYDEHERGVIRASLERIYQLFLERVSAGRDMSLEEVDEIGAGRVWTGRQALERGLVDELGGLPRAIERAKERAGLDPRAMVRLIAPRKRVLAPAPSPSSTLQYVTEGLRLIQSGRALCICPIVLE